VEPTQTSPHLYNLFPRLTADMRGWREHAERAARMGFDWLYLNPVHFPGFSGSCYAVKDFFRIDPLLLPEGHPDKNWDDALRGDGGRAALAQALADVRAAGLRPVMDLVLNHTARDSPLVLAHPEWYARDAAGDVQSPSAIDPADARIVTVWGDLAEIDNAGSADRAGLWAFWKRVVETYAGLGFEGFRCDAAYKVPAALWRELIATARSRQPGALFFGETLGARLEEVEALRESGLPFTFNSSKWWNFDAPWCLDQQHDLPPGTRSISFPESHDTPRLWQESGGNERVQRQRYAFAAVFSSGVLMPAGYEFGFARRIDVVETRAEQWETPQVDLSPFVTRVNSMRRQWPALCTEAIAAVTGLDQAALGLEKRTAEGVAWVAINKDLDAPQSVALPAAARGRRVLYPCRDAAAHPTMAGELDAHAAADAPVRVGLEPGEVAYVV
jgi:starch synthase (maltosyl-transferring)